MFSEYITTLEGQISDRDKLISAIREELGAQKLENAELRQEIDNLKKAMLNGAPIPAGLPPPSATSSISPGPTPAPTTRRTATLAKANPNKDVGGSGSFWGGAASSSLGGVTSVHRMVVPEFPPLALAGKTARNWNTFPLSTATLGTLPGHAMRLAQDNINPNMNTPRTTTTSSSSSSSSSEGASSPASSSESTISTPPQSPPLNLISTTQPWNGFGDINPFTIKTLDGYRMQLWSKMAAAGHVPPAQQQQPTQQQQQQLFNTYSSGLTGQLRPAFFDTPESSASGSSSKKASSSSLSAILAGKTASNLAASSSSSHPAPPTSPNPKAAALPTNAQQAAAAAAAASLVTRMSSAFRDAFAQPASKSWDVEKVKKVLEGKAVLKVVDVDQLHHMHVPTATSTAVMKKSPLLRAKSVDPGLEEKMSRLSLNMSTGLSREDREVDSMLLAAPSAMKTSAFKTLLK